MRFDKGVAKFLASAGVSLSILISGSFLVAPWEGKVNKTYLDPIGIVTSCYGHTGKELKLGQKFTDEQCYEQLRKDLIKANEGVRRLTKVQLNVYQEASLTSFVYNAGEGNLAKSTMLKKFNSKDYVGGCEQLVNWVYANRKKLQGLVNRREDEMAVCLGDKDVIKFISESLKSVGI